MTPELDEPTLALLAEILNRQEPTFGKGSPAQHAAEYLRSAGAVLGQRLHTELRILHLVSRLVQDGITDLVIYGSAEVGRSIARTARDQGLRVRYFVESKVAFEGRQVDGIEVVRLARARAEGLHSYAVATVVREREVTGIIQAGYQDQPQLPLRIYPVPPASLGQPAPAGGNAALAERARLLESLLGRVRQGGTGLYAALLERTALTVGAEPAAPAEPPPARPAASWPASPLDPRLLKAATPLAAANLQFTGDCNLKCTYCGHADSGWSGTRMTEAMIDQIFEFIIQDRVQKVMIGFFGEATLFQGWERLCERLLAAGVALATNSNFLRPLRAEEVDVLSRFTEIAMSIDTVDQELQKRLRPPMDVRNLVHAFHRIRGRALATGRKVPYFIWTGVLTPEVVPLLPEFFAYAKSCGVPRLNLNEVCPIEESACMDNLYDLDDAAFVRMTEQLGQAVALAETLGLELTLPLDGIAERLERSQRRLAGEACEELPKVRIRSFQGTAVFPFQRIPEGKVPLCHSPWNSVHIMPTGEVFPCCFQGTVMGTVSATVGLREVLDNERYRAFRASLLTGEGLNETCRHCMLVRRVVDPAEARAVAADMLGITPHEPA